MPIYVLVLRLIDLTFLELIILLGWELWTGMRSTRPKGQVLEGFFTVSYVIAVTMFLAAGVAGGSWFATSSVLVHRSPAGLTGDASPGARMAMLLAARMAGCQT